MDGVMRGLDLFASHVEYVIAQYEPTAALRILDHMAKIQLNKDRDPSDPAGPTAAYLVVRARMQDRPEKIQQGKKLEILTPVDAKWARKSTKTRAEMDELGLPHDPDSKLAVVISDEIVDKRRWVTVYELVFRLVGMPEDLAYRTHYEVGSTEMQDGRPWEYEDAKCYLVRSVPRVTNVWEVVE